MNELKAKHAFDVYEEYTKTGDDEQAQVYLKSEVDNLQQEFERLKKCEQWMKDHFFVEEFATVRIRRQKYKRCEALAAWCDSNVYAMLNAEKNEAVSACKLFYRSRALWWGKWSKRWCGIAEMFKEAS